VAWQEVKSPAFFGVDIMSRKPATVPGPGAKKAKVSRTLNKPHPTFMDLHDKNKKTPTKRIR